MLTVLFMPTTTSTILARILILLLPVATLAQNSQTINTKKLADVNVIVTDFKKVVRPGEQIIFISKKNGSKFSGRAGKDGKFSLQLPSADTFTIKVKNDR